jgi:nitrogen fixation protein NifU and related proteins
MDVNRLYQELVLQWNRDPRYRQALLDCTHTALGNNPLCGDQLKLSLRVVDAKIDAAGFEGEMSAITTASTAIMCDLLMGQSFGQARALADAALAMLNQGTAPSIHLGEFAAFNIVRNYPNRIKTATLPWATLLAILDGQSTTTTEQ